MRALLNSARRFIYKRFCHQISMRHLTLEIEQGKTAVSKTLELTSSRK
jgi:hypothetical protein